MKLNSLISVLAVGVAASVHAQNNTSPYSIVGIGDIEKSSFDRTTGMGYAGVALSSSRSIYNINPASFAVLGDKLFNVETAIRYKAVTYAGLPITDVANNNSSDLVSKKIVFAIKPKPNWGLSFGLLPFSSSNYSFTAKKTVQGTGVTTDAYYEGSGSINQAYVANAFSIAKGLRIGLQLSYLFGQQQQEETISSDLGNGTLYTKRNVAIGKSFALAGIQYETNINSKWVIALGATASNKTTLNANYSLLVQDGGQTISNTENDKTAYFTLPTSFTLGAAATLKDKYTFAIDYHHEDWNSAGNTTSMYKLVNIDRLSTGFQYSQKKKLLPAPGYPAAEYEKAFFQAGLFYSNSYLKVYGQQLNDYGFTLGAGLHAKRSGLGLQGSLEIGKRGTTANGLIKENYTQFTLTVLYKEFWFGRRRYN